MSDTAKPTPIPPASAHLQTQSAPAPTATSPAPTATIESQPEKTQSSESRGAAGTTPDAGKADQDPDVTGRLARIAREQRRLEKSKEEWKTAQKADLEAAASWRNLQEARTSKGRMAALDALFDAGEIEGDLYTELTERIYKKGEGAQLTPADVDKRVEEKLAAARKTEEETRAKAETDAKAVTAARQQESEGKYLDYVNGTFEAAKDKFPTLSAVLEDLPEAVTGSQILAHVRSTMDAYVKEHGSPDGYQAPTAEDVLGHFEAKLAKRFRPQDEERPTPAGARVLPRGDAQVRPDRSKSVKESWEEIKKRFALPAG